MQLSFYFIYLQDNTKLILIFLNTKQMINNSVDEGYTETFCIALIRVNPKNEQKAKTGQCGQRQKASVCLPLLGYYLIL